MKSEQRELPNKRALSPKPTTPIQESVPEPAWLRFSPVYLVLVVLAVYIRVVGFGFVGFDDMDILKARYFIIGHLYNVRLAFTTDAFLGTSGSFYRPLQTVSFMVDAAFGGPGPMVYHVTNLLLHTSATLCVFWLLVTLGYKRLHSLLLSLLFAVHPLFVIMVGWIPTRGDLLLTIFAIISFILFVKAYRTHNPQLLLVHGVALFFAFLSKETAVAVPVLCLVYYWLEIRKNLFNKFILKCVAIWVPVGGTWYWLRSLLHIGQTGDTLGGTALLNNLPMLPELIGKFFAPVNFQLVPLFSRRDTLTGIVVIALLIALIILAKQTFNKRIHLGVIWFLLCIFPVMMFRNGDARYIFDYLYHRSYLPSVGLLIVLCELMRRIEKPIYAQRVLLVALPILAFCGITSFRELQYYRSPLAFYNEAVARTPRNALCYNNRAVYYGNEKHDHKAALEDFTRAIELFPDYISAILNRGVTYENLGKPAEAKADLEVGLKLRPNDPNTLFHLGNLRYLMNDFVGAIEDYNRVLTMNKLFPRIFSKKAGSEAMLGRSQEALRDAAEALQVDANDEEAYNSRGLARRLMGQLDGAGADFDHAIRIKNDYSRPYNNRGTIYLAQGNTQRALDDFDKAIELDPTFAEPYSNRGSVKHGLGKDDSALKDLDTAVQLSPNFADAYQNRGVVRNVLKLFPDALADFNQSLKFKPENGGAYLGRGISKLYLGDHTGSCEDWKRAATLGSKDATSLLAEYCK